MRFKQYLKEKTTGVAIKKGANINGIQYALVQLKDTDKYVVYARKENYKLGKIMKTWVFVTPKKMDFQAGQRYAKQGVSYEEALALYNKKIKGKARH